MKVSTPVYKDVHLKPRVKDWGYPDLLVAELLRRLKLSPDYVADFGYGTGSYARAWLRAGCAVVGFDREATTEEFHTAKCDFNQTLGPQWDLTFDVVFSKSVVEHLDAPTQFVRSAHKVLHKGGLFVCICPDWKTSKDVFYDDYTHVRPYTVDSLHDLLSTEFITVSTSVFWQSPFAWKHPRLFRIIRPIARLFMAGDARVRWSNAAILGVARK